MEVETLIVRPSLLGVGELLGRALIVGYVNSKLRLTQIKINTANQQQHDEDRSDSDSLHTPILLDNRTWLLAVRLLTVVNTRSTPLALDTLPEL